MAARTHQPAVCAYDPDMGFTWRGTTVEVNPVALDDPMEIARRLAFIHWKCMRLEELDVTPSLRSLRCMWFDDMQPDDPLRELLKECPEFYQRGMTQADHVRRVSSGMKGVVGGTWTPGDSPTREIAWCVLDQSMFSRWNGHTAARTTRLTTPLLTLLVNSGWYIADVGQPAGWSTRTASLHQIRAWLASHGIVDSWIEYRRGA